MAKGLGKGINAFFPNVDLNKEESVQEIKLKEIRPNPYQPRKHFEEDAIQELKESILQHGILQPNITTHRNERINRSNRVAAIFIALHTKT